MYIAKQSVNFHMQTHASKINPSPKLPQGVFPCHKGGSLLALPSPHTLSVTTLLTSVTTGWFCQFLNFMQMQSDTMLGQFSSAKLTNFNSNLRTTGKCDSSMNGLFNGPHPSLLTTRACQVGDYDTFSCSQRESQKTNYSQFSSDVKGNSCCSSTEG